MRPVLSFLAFTAALTTALYAAEPVLVAAPTTTPNTIITDAKPISDITAARRAEHATRSAKAYAALKADKADIAEQELDALQTGLDPKSPEANKLLAVNLMGLAYQARSAGDNTTAQRAARRALRAIERAEARLADNPEKLAALQLTRATLMEDFLGNSTDAEVHLREAARLDPNNPTAQERKARLDSRQEDRAARGVKPLTEAVVR